MKRCVAYCRVSTDSDNQLNSIENQKNYYLDMFKREGYSPARVGLLYRRNGSSEPLQGIFADEGISGTSLKNRHSFNYMIELAKKKEFDVIYTKSVSRFARSVEDGVRILKDLREVGVEVIFEDCNVSSLDPSNEILINMLASVAQQESVSRSIAVKFGIRALQRKGGSNTLPAYGYDKEKGFLKINEQEAKIVELVYKLFLEDGFGTGKICRYLNQNKILSKKGKTWSQRQIVDILGRELYIGKFVTHKKETDDVNRKTIKYIDEDEWIVTTLEHLRIIDDNTFKATQLERMRRKAMTHKGTRNSCANLLSNLLYCGNCGGSLKRKKRKAYVRKDGTKKDLGYEWTCQFNDMYGKEKCGYRNQVIEDTFLDHLKQEIIELKNRDMSNLFELYKQLAFNYDSSEEKVNKLNKEIKKMEHKIDLNFELYSEGEIDKVEFKRRSKTLHNLKDDLQHDLDKILNIEQELKKVQNDYKEFIEYFDSLDVENISNVILKKVFNKIIVKTIGDVKLYQYIYNFLDSSFDEIINKAGKAGFKIKKVDLTKVS